MALLVRHVKKGELWARAEDQAKWQGDNFPYDILSDLTDATGTGLSFWEIQSRRDPDLRRIIAALSVGSNAPQARSADFRVINSQDVAQLGLTIGNTIGNTKDTGINHLHRDLHGLAGPRAVELARKLSQNRSIAFKSAEVAKFIANSVIKEFLPWEEISKDLLSDLRKRGAVSVVLHERN